MIAGRVGPLKFNFLPNFLHILLPLFGVQIKRSCRLHPPWNAGQIFFQKNRPKTCSKHVWTLLGTILATFEKFLISLKFSEDSTLLGTLGNFFFEKIAPKHVQNMFGHFWEGLWAFLEF